MKLAYYKIAHEAKGDNKITYIDVTLIATFDIFGCSPRINVPGDSWKDQTILNTIVKTVLMHSVGCNNTITSTIHTM